MATPISSGAPGAGRNAPKQSSPVRLPEEFYRRVRATAEINMRSIPKELEYLVEIAEGVKDYVSRDDLLDVQAGLKRIVVEDIESPRVEPASLLDSLQSMRESGLLAEAVSEAEPRYQASGKHPGLLERINPDGSRELGTFRNGKFRISKTR